MFIVVTTRGIRGCVVVSGTYDVDSRDNDGREWCDCWMWKDRELVVSALRQVLRAWETRLLRGLCFIGPARKDHGAVQVNPAGIYRKRFLPADRRGLLGRGRCHMPEKQSVVRRAATTILQIKHWRYMPGESRLPRSSRISTHYCKLYIQGVSNVSPYWPINIGVTTLNGHRGFQYFSGLSLKTVAYTTNQPRTVDDLKNIITVANIRENVLENMCWTNEEVFGRK